LRVTEIGSRFVQRELQIAPLESTQSLFHKEWTQEITNVCHSAGSLTVEELIEKVKKVPFSTEVTFQHIARLIKYGILEMENDKPGARYPTGE
jgi:hypothetical protein